MMHGGLPSKKFSEMHRSSPGVIVAVIVQLKKSAKLDGLNAQKYKAPYVVLIAGKRVSYSRVISRELPLVWNEIRVFYKTSHEPIGFLIADRNAGILSNNKLGLTQLDVGSFFDSILEFSRDYQLDFVVPVTNSEATQQLGTLSLGHSVLNLDSAVKTGCTRNDPIAMSLAAVFTSLTLRGFCDQDSEQKTLEKIADLYERAALHPVDHVYKPMALINFALALKYGRGVPIDLEESTRLMQVAMGMGSSEATINHAINLIVGTGLQPDPRGGLVILLDEALK